MNAANAIVVANVVNVEGFALERSGDDLLIRDIDLAEHAGLKNPRDIRTTIETNRVELEENGAITMRRRHQRIAKSGAVGGTEVREVSEYHLNEAQAFNVVALLRTDEARKLRPKMARVYVKARRGLLVPVESAAMNVDPSMTARMGESPLHRREISQHCAMVARACNRPLASIHGYVRKTFNTPGIYKLPIVIWPAVRDTLNALALGNLLLPTKPHAPLRLVDRKQENLPGVWE